MTETAPTGGARIGRFLFYGVFMWASVVVIYLIPLSPHVMLRSMSSTTRFALVGIVFPLLVAVVAFLRSRFPRTILGLSIVYWIPNLVFSLMLSMILRAMDWVYFWLAVALALSALIPYRNRLFARWVPPATVVLLTSFAAVDIWFNSRILGVAAVACGAAGVGLAVLMAKSGAIRKVSPFAVGMAAFCILIYGRGFFVYKLDFPGYAPRIVSQPGVSAVYTLGDPWWYERVPLQTYFLAPIEGDGQYIVGPQVPFHELTFIGKRGDPVRRVELGSRGSENFQRDPDDPDLIYVASARRFFRISLSEAAIVDSITVPGSQFNLDYVRYDAKNDRFFITEDCGNELQVVDRKTFSRTGTIRKPPNSSLDDAWIDPIGNQVLVSYRCYTGRLLVSYDLDTFEQTGSLFNRFDHGFDNGTLDVEGRRLYLVSTITGKVYIVDVDRMEKTAEFKLELGLRDCTFDPVRRWALIGSYFRGRLFALDVDRGRVLGPVFLGRRLRWVQVNDDGTYTAPTSSGGFVIDPDAAFTRVHAEFSE